LRIKTIYPTGFYLSSANPEAAKYWFLREVVQWAMASHLFPPNPGCFIGVEEHPLDWQKLLKEGQGDVFIETHTRDETEALKKVSTREIIPSAPKMVTDRWSGPNKEQLWMVRDPGDLIDSWLLDSMKSDLGVGKPN